MIKQNDLVKKLQLMFNNYEVTLNRFATTDKAFYVTLKHKVSHKEQFASLYIIDTKVLLYINDLQINIM